MKKILFFFTMLASVAASAQTGITVMPISTDYANQTVGFSVSWLNSSRTGTHNSKVWVFVDYRTITGNVPSGSWTRALISGTPTATTGTPSRETGNDKGFWLQGTSGSSGTYNATVTVKLSGVPAKFNWCAYVSDYPPNVTVNNGTYTFKGTPPFILKDASGNITQTIPEKTLPASSLITSPVPVTLTDKTECPNAFCAMRDEALNGRICCAGLTVVGSYCRNLTADDAFALTCSGSTIEVKNSDAGNVKWADRNICPSGWRIPTGSELKCMCQNNKLNTTTNDLYWAASMSGYEQSCNQGGWPYTVAWVSPQYRTCDAGAHNACTIVRYHNIINTTMKVRCVR